MTALLWAFVVLGRVVEVVLLLGVTAVVAVGIDSVVRR